ncbi:MAG: hypothetical protein AAF658_02660 [Myxococcota bacterium]
MATARLESGSNAAGVSTPAEVNPQSRERSDSGSATKPQAHQMQRAGESINEWLERITPAPVAPTRITGPGQARSGGDAPAKSETTEKPPARTRPRETPPPARPPARGETPPPAREKPPAGDEAKEPAKGLGRIVESGKNFIRKIGTRFENVIDRVRGPDSSNEPGPVGRAIGKSVQWAKDLGPRRQIQAAAGLGIAAWGGLSVLGSLKASGMLLTGTVAAMGPVGLVGLGLLGAALFLGKKKKADAPEDGAARSGDGSTTVDADGVKIIIRPGDGKDAPRNGDGLGDGVEIIIDPGDGDSESGDDKPKRNVANKLAVTGVNVVGAAGAGYLAIPAVQAVLAGAALPSVFVPLALAVGALVASQAVVNVIDAGFKQFGGKSEEA